MVAEGQHAANEGNGKYEYNIFASAQESGDYITFMFVNMGLVPRSLIQCNCYLHAIFPSRRLMQKGKMHQANLGEEITQQES